nr:MAG TPA: hypothetical protein [Caudoviricetes sp.]
MKYLPLNVLSVSKVHGFILRLFFRLHLNSIRGF